MLSGATGSCKGKCSSTLETVYKLSFKHTNPWNDFLNASYSSWILLEITWSISLKSSPWCSFQLPQTQIHRTPKLFVLEVRNSYSASQIPHFFSPLIFLHIYFYLIYKVIWQYLLCAQHSFKRFININWFNPPNNPLTKGN